MLFAALPFEPIEVTQEHAETFLKYAVPILVFIFIVVYVFNAAKRSGRKF
jgi:hypothetical protein